MTPPARLADLLSSLGRNRHECFSSCHVFLPTVQSRKLFSQFTLKAGIAPVASGIISKDVYNLFHALRSGHSAPQIKASDHFLQAGPTAPSPVIVKPYPLNFMRSHFC